MKRTREYNSDDEENDLTRLKTHHDHEFQFQLSRCLRSVERVLTSTKSMTLTAANKAPHKYDDKYLLAEQLVGCAAASVWNTLLALGLTEEQYQVLRTWRQQGTAVTLRAEFVHSCAFKEEHIREEESASEVETNGSKKKVTKVVTKITDFIFTLRCAYRLMLFRGADATDGTNVVVLAEHQGQQECAQRTNSAPSCPGTQHQLAAGRPAS